MTRVLFVLLILGWAMMPSGGNAQEVAEPLVRPELPKEWSRAVRGFRREHNFSVSYGLVTSRWKGHLTDDANIFSFSNEGHQARISYSFHLPLMGRFGYYLGTQTSVLVAASSRDSKGGEISYGLPGLNVGVILNLSDRVRVASGLELGWHRIEKLGLPESFERKRISVTGETRTWNGQVDYFYELSWAVQLTYEASELNYAPAESLSLHKVSRSWSLGILKHLI
ncbi:MAG TPA: hypothetical protein VE954_13375 [Oligoflexus sp.]|uniref:hypothetical protein n=1 Tax=Oligoflexus sp. TaxID=1971216 RepID=UPI002D381FC8|nr:hypothetical protein [Oligoflexus sp.]HYX34097.1 hypothetical protein [Oligoflexus sp.]